MDNENKDMVKDDDVKTAGAPPMEEPPELHQPDQDTKQDDAKK